MGIVLKQSFKNTLILFIGFAIGGINVLFIYTHFLHEDYYGLNTFLLSTANILSPLMVLGMQHTIIKFFTTYDTKFKQDQFLTNALFLPLLIIIPIGIMGAFTYDSIASWLSTKNAIIKPFTYLIFFTSICIGYFEVFYAFSKVQYQSVFGNFIKEVFARICATMLLFTVYMDWITDVEFIYAIAIVYAIRMIIMMVYAFSLYKPQFIFTFPSNSKEILSYSFYIIMAGSASGILLDIDKVMIPQLEQIAEVAYYAVGIYIASVIAIPSRAMQQIINPLTAKALNNNNLSEVKNLYKKSSITLLVAGGLLFLLININIIDLYIFINKPEYAVGGMIVLMISIAELYKLALGTNGAILTNSNHYKVFFYFSIAMALSVIILNRWLIEFMGIDGAALATLIVVLAFSTFKIVYIQIKMKMQPFSVKTLQIITVIVVLFFLFYFLHFPYHPLINMTIKSIIIVLLYVVVVVKLNISNDVNALVQKYLKK